MSDAGEEGQGAQARRRRRRGRGSGGRPGTAARATDRTMRANGGRTEPGSGSRRTGTGGGATARGSSNARSGARPSTRREDGSGTRAADTSPRRSPRASTATATAPASGPASAGDAPLGAHELADAQNEERRGANRRRLRALVLAAAAAPAVVLGVVIGIAGGVIAGAAVAVVVLVALVFSVSRWSMAFALRLVGGTPVRDGALPSLANQVEGLCATLGVAHPELRLVDEPVANACALSGRRGHAVLVVTSGLLDRLGLIEMEGVVAHELVHVRRRDASVSAVAVATAGVVAWVTGRDGLVHLAVGRGREYGADQAAALAVRYPTGLHDALASMGGRPSGSGSPFSGRRWAATRWIWIDPMVGEVERAPLGELDATAVRMDALGER